MNDGERSRWFWVARGVRVPRGVPVAVRAEGAELVLVRNSAGLRCFQGLCPHQGAALAEGALHGDVLLCPKHRWRFDAEGRRIDGPGCLQSYSVKEQDGDVWVALHDSAPLPRDPA